MAAPIKSEYLVHTDSILESLLPPGTRYVTYSQLNLYAHRILPVQTRKIYQLMSRKIIVRNNNEVIPDPFNYKRVAIKNNISNWGSCSTGRNINLNLHLVRIPQALMNYVIAHELCHLVYFDHSPRFHAIMNAVTDGRERELERVLKRISLTY